MDKNKSIGKIKMREVSYKSKIERLMIDVEVQMFNKYENKNK